MKNQLSQSVFNFYEKLFFFFFSFQASPSPCGVACVSPANTPQQSRRPSLLHPDHARLHLHHSHHNHHNSGSKNPPSPDRTSIDEDVQPVPPSPSSSTTSSLRSMPSSAMCSASMHSADRRRSSRSVFYYIYQIHSGERDNCDPPPTILPMTASYCFLIH